MSMRYDRLASEFKSTVTSLSLATNSTFEEVDDILSGKAPTETGSKASEAQMALSRLLHNIEELRGLFDDLEKAIHDEYS